MGVWFSSNSIAVPAVHLHPRLTPNEVIFTIFLIWSQSFLYKNLRLGASHLSWLFKNGKITNMYTIIENKHDEHVDHRLDLSSTINATKVMMIIFFIQIGSTYEICFKDYNISL